MEKQTIEARSEESDAHILLFKYRHLDNSSFEANFFFLNAEARRVIIIISIY